MKLPHKEARALRLLAEQPAEELLMRPMPVLARLQRRGFAFVAYEYLTPRHGTARSIAITREGRAALAKGGGDE